MAKTWEPTSLGRMIKAGRARLGLTQAEFGARVGLSQESIVGLETGHAERGPTTHTRAAPAIAAALGISDDEMNRLMALAKEETGKNTRIPARVRDAVRTHNAPHFPPTDRTSPFADRADKVPILGQAVGGDDGKMQFNGSVAGWVDRPISLLGVPDAYAVFVAGESMEPRYRAGETVWVHPRKPPHVGADVVVQLQPDEDGEPPFGFIKEYRGRNAETVVLRQYNPARDIKVGSSRVISIHPVVLAER